MFCVENSTYFDKMKKTYENEHDPENEADPEQLLNEVLGNLNTLTVGLDPINTTSNTTCNSRTPNPEIAAPRIDGYRFSMANLEDTQDVDLDAILGELCALESECDREIGNARNSKRLSDAQKLAAQHHSRTHSRSSIEGPRLKMDTSDNELHLKTDSMRTDSPDNDSAFSDTVSMLSSESSASSGGSGSKPHVLHLQGQDEASRVKAEKIRMAMEKIKEANIQKLFVKIFTHDGSSKSLLIDEKMLCSYVTRLLADKNHVVMDPKWAIVEHLPELYMERIYEDHELIVENLMLWTRESKNKIYFSERLDKIKLFMQPEKFLISPSDRKDTSEYDEHYRNMLLEEFFASNSGSVPTVEGPLYLKSDSKKGWKKYHFVLRASGLYYFPKDKVKSAKDLVCLATFENNQIYYGLSWKKKFKAPSDFCFAIKHPRLQEAKASKYIKYLCAEDYPTLERWMIGMRIAKYGKQLMDNYRNLMDELAQEDLDNLAHARSCSVSSIAVQSNATTPTQDYMGSEAGYGTQSEPYSASSEASSGRHSRASSSSSSGCMSDGTPSSCENGFDSEFPMGTIKRKPSMKPTLPLTNITRQLKEVGETRDEMDHSPSNNLHSPVYSTQTGTLTRRHSRRKSNNSLDSNDSNNMGTLKRTLSYKNKGSIDGLVNNNNNNNNRSNGGSPLYTPVKERTPVFEEKGLISSGSFGGGVSSHTLEMMSMTDSITSLPPPPENSDESLCCENSLPPPPPEIYNSNLSLDSLPPPPNPHDLPKLDSELTGSQLSLMSLPPPPGEDTGTLTRRKGSITPTNCQSPNKTPTVLSPDQTPTPSRISTPCFSPPLSHQGSNCSTPTQTHPPVTFSPPHHAQLQHNHYSAQERVSNGYAPQPIYAGVNRTLPGGAFNGTSTLRSSFRQVSLPRQISSNSIASSSSSSSANSILAPCLQEIQSRLSKQPPSPKKTTKKISFNLPPQEVPPLPKKPTPPRRSDSTKLTSPKRLPEPPCDFLKDLQRVMKKKWQVAQKCKLEPETTPHEVLGFRDAPVLLPEYKEHNVSNWVQEHYGPNNVYENIYRDNPDAVVEYASSPIHAATAAPSSNRNSEVRNSSGSDYSNRSKRPPPPPPKRSETTTLSNNTALPPPPPGGKIY